MSENPQGYIYFNPNAFEAGNESTDRYVLDLAGGLNAPIIIVPTINGAHYAASKLAKNVVKWFGKLGATQIEVIPISHKRVANDPMAAAKFRKAKYICFAGTGFNSLDYGDTLNNHLPGSLCLRAMLEAYNKGAVINGALKTSGILGEYICYYDAKSTQLLQGLEFLEKAVFISSKSLWGKRELKYLIESRFANVIILSSDGDTSEASLLVQNGHATVMGNGVVKMIKDDEHFVYETGQSFSIY